MRRGGLSLLTALGVAAMLAGCVSTEQKATWAHIESERILASQNPTVVRRGNPNIRVIHVALVKSGTQLAVAVTMRNLDARPVNDLPISVGLRREGRALYLNRGGNLGYFDTHVAEIPAAGETTWVFTGASPPRKGRPAPSVKDVFVRVGTQVRPAITVARKIPAVRAVLVDSRATSIRIRATNLSSVPQVPLEIYALAGDRGRYVAIGRGAVPNLGAGSTATAKVDLIGRITDKSPINVEVLPTLFR